MKIKNIYCLEGNAYINLIETPDGKLYTFNAVPYRVLTEKDLTPVTSPLSNKMYLRASHAFKATESFSAKQYGLEIE